VSESSSPPSLLLSSNEPSECALKRTPTARPPIGAEPALHGPITPRRPNQALSIHALPAILRARLRLRGTAALRSFRSLSTATLTRKRGLIHGTGTTDQSVARSG